MNRAANVAVFKRVKSLKAAQSTRTSVKVRLKGNSVIVRGVKGKDARTKWRFARAIDLQRRHGLRGRLSKRDREVLELHRPKRFYG